MEKPLFTYKPVFSFVGLLDFRAQLRRNEFRILFLVPAAIIGVVMLSAVVFNYKDSTMALFLFGAPLVFTVSAICLYTVSKSNYAKTEYKFFPNRVEFEDGVFATQNNQIKLNDIKEVVLSQETTQQASGLGSVYLITDKSICRGGVEIKDIENYEEAYKKIKQLINSSKSN